MQIKTHFTKLLRQAFSGGLFGVVLFILIPQNLFAQVDSLQLTQSLDGLAQSLLRYADYDSDGDLDLIIAGTNSGSVPIVRLYKNNGSASFTEDHNSSITGFNYPGIGWGDVDGDGDLDFAISGNTSTGYQAKLYQNNGSGVFTEAASDPFYDAYWGNMEMGDLDNDGDLDIFQTGLQSNGVRVADIFWNDGKGTFTKDTTNTFTGTADGETPLADLDNDGDLDILLSGYVDAGGNITQIHLNDGTGTFTQSQSLQGVAANGMDFGDYDNDGDLDLILIGLDYGASARRANIYKNDGNASFSIDATNTIASASSSNAKWGDYDHDGDLDLIVSGFTDAAIRETYIYTNDGSGSMSYTSNGAITGSEEGYVDWADLDGDGFLEVAITGWNGTTRITRVYQNIRTKSNTAPTVPTNLMASADLDSISFSWDASTDSDGGPISYSLYYRSADSSRFVIPAFADTATGKRAINGLGNNGLHRTHKIAKSDIPYGEFNWGVQAIDGSGSASAFAKSTSTISPEIPVELTASRNDLSVNLSWLPNDADSVEYYIIYKEDNKSEQIDSVGFTSDTSFTFSNLAYGNTYDFYAAVRTVSGAKSELSIPVEVVIPSLFPPDGFIASRNELTADLIWTTFTETPVDYYIIYKEDNNSGLIDSLGFTTDTTFSYNGLNYGNTYGFYLEVKTANGFKSSRSDVEEVIVPSLDAPTNLEFSRNGVSVDLNWDANLNVSVDYYIIYREANNSGQVDSVGFSNTNTFSYSDLLYGNTYNFYVSTKTTTGFNSSLSDSLEVLIPSVSVPQNLTYLQNKQSIDLSWSAVNNVPVDYYIIYKEEDNSGQIDSLGFSNDTTFSFTGFDYAKTYDFYVATRATNGQIGSRSDSVEVLVQAISSFTLNPIDASGFQPMGSIKQIIDFDFGDYDLDGDFDLLAFGFDTLSSSYLIRVLNNDGVGNFSNGSFTLTEVENSDLQATTIYWVDVNLDNKLDIFANGLTTTGTNTRIYLNNGDGTFSDANADLLKSFTSTSYLWADLDTDGDDDLLLQGNPVNGNGFLTLFYRNDGAGYLSVPDSNLFMVDLELGVDYAYSNTYGPFERYDYDNDRDLDLVANNSSNELAIFENKGSLIFEENTSLPLDNIRVRSIEIADANDDGYKDLMVQGTNSANVGKIELYLNNSTGNSYQNGFTKYTGYDFPDLDKADIKIRDLNNDGYSEFVIAGDSSGVDITRVYSNNYGVEASFVVIPVNVGSLTGLRTSNIEALDLDNDNDLDIFISGDNTSAGFIQHYMYKNETLSIFQAVVNSAVYAPTAEIRNDSLRISDLPSYGDYTFYLYHQSLSKYFISPSANISNGFRSKPERAQVEFYKHDWDGSSEIGLAHRFDRKSIPGGTYTIGVQGIENDSGIGSAFKTSTVKFVPLAPENVVIQEDSVNQSVSITWNQNPGTNTSKYIIYQTQDTLLTANSSDLSQKDYSDIIIGETTDTTFTHNNAPINTNLYYYVSAFTDDIDIYPNYSEPSKVDSANINVPILMAPANLSYTRNELSVDLVWDPENEFTVDYYIIYKEDNNSGQVDSLDISNDATFTYGGLNYGNTYDFYVATKTTAGFTSDRSDSVEVTVPALTAPAGLTATRNELAVDLEWNSVQGVSLDYYIIYRELNNSGQIDSVGFANDTTFSFPSLSYGNTYDFYVATKTTAGVTSAQSDSVEVVVPALNAPVGLMVDRNELTANLEWNSVAGVSIDYYIIYKEDNNSSQVDSLGFSNDTTFTYDGLNYGNTYGFYVAAKTTSGFTSDLSDSVEVTIPVFNAPDGPTNLYATKGNLSATLTWDLVDDPAFASYKVFIESSLTTPTIPDSTTTDTSIVINNLIDGNEYYFYVAWVDSINRQSLLSDSVRVSFKFPLQIDATLSSQIQRGNEYHWVDVDNDGDLDLHIYEDVLPTILRNNGNGSFSSTTIGSAFYQSQNPGSTQSYTDWVDHNGDGFIDVMGISGSAVQSSFLADNNGTDFTRYSTLATIELQYHDGMASWGDFNNDGEVEFAATAGSDILTMLDIIDDTVRTISNVTFPAYTGDQGALHWLDFNQDGYRDIAVYGADGWLGVATFKLFLNNGDSTFSDAGISLPELAEADLDWGDIDNDGDLDAVYMGFDYDTFAATGYIFKNNGSGGFDAGVQFDGLENGEVEFGDYDNDGDLDFFALGTTGFRHVSPDAHIYTNDGTGVFTKKSTANITALTYGRGSWADFDKDGDLDLVTGGFLSSGGASTPFYKNEADTPNTPPDAPSNLALNIQNGEHVFTWDKPNDAEGGPISYEVMLKRKGYTVLNGIQDAFVSPFHSDTTTGFRRKSGMGNNDITRKYVLNSSLLKSGDYTIYVQAIDGSQGASTFAKHNFSIAAQPTPTNVAISKNGSDFTISWDSVASAVSYNVYVATDSSSIDSLFTNTMDTSFTIQNVSQGTIEFYTVSAVSQNGSESVNSSFVELNYPILLSLNQNISITGYAGVDPGNAFASTSDIEWVDIDNDGDLDLTILGTDAQGGSSIEVRKNTNSSFSVLSYMDFHWEYGKMDWADYNGDGFVDLVVSGKRDANETAEDGFSLGEPPHSLIIYQNNSGNTFTRIDSIGTINFSVGTVEWVDIDNDGDLDIYRNGFSGAADNRLYRNQNGIFTEEYITLTGRNIGGSTSAVSAFGDVQWIDINSDGYMDYTGAGMTRIFGAIPGTDIIFNSSDGTLTDSGNDLTAFANAALDWGDFDADGDPDLVLMGSVEQTSNDRRIEIFSNDGLGNLSPVDTLSGFAFGDIAWADYDNDGDLDLVANGFVTDKDASSASAKLIENTPNGFVEVQGINLTGLALGGVAWGDYDNDGDLDLAMNGLNNNGYYTLVYTNIVSGGKNAPTSPQNIGITVSGDEFEISWDASTDTEGGPITYNTFLTKAGQNAIVSSNSDTTNGFSRVSSLGNNDYNTIKKLDVSNFESGVYRFGVQAIDGTGTSSSFTVTDLPIREYFNVSVFNAVRDTSILIPQNSLRINSIFSDSTFTISAPQSYSSEIYIDVNENLRRDAGEPLLDQNNLTFDPSTTSFSVFADTTGIESVELVISTLSGAIRDTAIVEVAISESQPTYNGTADQGGWYLLSNPFQTTIGTLFNNIWTQGAINSNAPGGTPNIYTFSPDSAKYIAITTDLDTTKVTAGEGILVYIFPDDNYNDAVAPENGGWPKTLSNFGNPFGENISIPIKNMDVDGNGATSGSEGFQLMGNPYGFPVSIDSLVAELVKIDPIANRYVYRWDPINKQYSLNFTGAVDAYESFFVRTVQSGTSGTASFDYRDVHSSARLKTTEEKYSIEFTLSSGDISTGSYSIRLDESAVQGIDPKDGYYLGSFASNYTNIYSTIGDQPLSLNNLPLNLSEIIEIPLFIHSTEEGEHTLEWSIKDVPESWKFELEDPSSGTIIDLSDQSSFRFEQSNQQFKTKHSNVQSPELFAFHSQKMKGISSASNFILRINPGLASNSENDLGIPREVELYQNYPNPFNPSSVIRFGVPEQAPVQLEVFDVLGRKVMTLLNGEVKQPGRYNINFDGRSLASGMYIYRLVIGEKVLTKKMTLIK